MSSLKEYCNIYLYIKKTNATLFQLIEDTCTEHLFKYRFVTFFMPSSALLTKMKKEKPSDAANMIRALMVKGLFKSSAELKGDVMNMNGSKLTKLSDLKVKPDPKFVQWTGYDNLSVLLYEGSDIPSATAIVKKETKKMDKVIVNKKAEGGKMMKKPCKKNTTQSKK